MRLLRLAHSILDHSVVVLCFSDLCLRAPGRGDLGSVAGLALVLLVFCWLLVIQDLNLMFRLTVSPAKRASPKFIKMFFLLRAPFGQYGPVAAFELYLYTAVDSRPGPGGSRTTASCQP